MKFKYILLLYSYCLKTIILLSVNRNDNRVFKSTILLGLYNCILIKYTNQLKYIFELYKLNRSQYSNKRRAHKKSYIMLFNKYLSNV